MACLPHTRVSLLLPLLLLIVAGFFTVPCHCASPTDNTSQPGPAKEPQTLLDLCKTVHSYLALSFWKAINQNPALIYLPNDSILERRGYYFRYHWRKVLRRMGLKDMVEEDIKGDVEAYVDSVVKEIKTIRDAEGLPKRMKKFIPTDQQQLLLDILQSDLMSPAVLDKYGEYVKNMAGFRLKLLQNVDMKSSVLEQFESNSKACRKLFEWATMDPDAEVFEDFGESLFKPEVVAQIKAERDAYAKTQKVYFDKLLNMNTDEFRSWAVKNAAQLDKKFQSHLQNIPEEKERMERTVQQIGELKEQVAGQKLSKPSPDLMKTVTLVVEEEGESDGGEREDGDQMSGSPFGHIDDPSGRDPQPSSGDVASAKDDGGDPQAVYHDDGEGGEHGEDEIPPESRLE